MNETLAGAGALAGTTAGVVAGTPAGAGVADTTTATGTDTTMDTGMDIMPDYTMALSTLTISTASTTIVIIMDHVAADPLLRTTLPVADET